MKVSGEYVFVQVARVIVIGMCMFIGAMAFWGADDGLPFDHPTDRMTFRLFWLGVGVGGGLIVALFMIRRWARLP